MTIDIDPRRGDDAAANGGAPGASPRPAASSHPAASPHPADDIRLDDIVRLRKPHPCGSHAWRVVRVGAEIGLRCTGCEHKVLLPRRVYRQRFVERVARAAEPAPGE
ncbi:MAG: DUF951 domain-containing protein [Anaerolineae bacterium]